VCCSKANIPLLMSGKVNILRFHIGNCRMTVAILRCETADSRSARFSEGFLHEDMTRRVHAERALALSGFCTRLNFHLSVKTALFGVSVRERTEWTRNRGSIRGSARHFSSPQRPGQLLGLAWSPIQWELGKADGAST
jgi:hypothetical protein